MQTGKRHIRSGRTFDHLFSKPIGETITVKKRANLNDTIEWMKKVVTSSIPQTQKIAAKLQGASVKQTCSNIWNFCFHHFQYEKDAERKEQIRTPNRSWWDRKKGIDCDCLTVFISTVLFNLKIPHLWRMTRYQSASMEHIYPVAILPNGEEVIIDCVVHKFNYEVPYTEKQDVEMDLQIMNGFEQERFNEFGDKVIFENDLPIDAEDLFMQDGELDGLRDWLKRRRETKPQRQAERKERREEFKKLPLKEKVKRGLSRGLNVVNKINPAAAILRAGVLASMKLNLFKVASHLRFAYWTPQEARRRNMNMAKYMQLQQIRQKVEKIYFGAGGKPDALKKAIVTGRGNANRMVALNGLGNIGFMPNDEDDLRTILGDDLYFDEAGELEANRLNGLGEIASGAAIAAASGFIATISALVKKLGGLFNKGSKEDQQMQIQNNTDDANEKNRLFSGERLKAFLSRSRNRVNANTNQFDPSILLEPTDPNDPNASDPNMEEFNFMDVDSNARSAGDDNDDSNNSDNEKTADNAVVAWIKENKVATALIGLGVAGGLFWWYKSSQNKKLALNGTDQLSGTKATKQLTGAKKKKPKKKASSRPKKRKPQRLSTYALAK